MVSTVMLADLHKAATRERACLEFAALKLNQVICTAGFQVLTSHFVIVEPYSLLIVANKFRAASKACTASTFPFTRTASSISIPISSDMTTMLQVPGAMQLL